MKCHIHYSYRIVFIVLFFTTQIIATQAQRSRKLSTNGGTFIHQPRNNNSSTSRSSCSRELYRTIDGTCNNLITSTEYGASDIALYREMGSEYGTADRLNAMGGENRVSPRAISNAVIAQEGSLPSSRNLSSFVFTWGQFLDHDISLTPEGHTEYHPIALPDDETSFQAPIPFFRSEVKENTGVVNPREQNNLITSWIDASNVYGSDLTRANWLRTFQEGKLKTSTGNLLPYNTTDGELNSPIDPNAPSMAATPTAPEKVFVAGDVRANEQPGLTALHTLFVREHNRICDRLQAEGETNDQEIYQSARKHIGALMQVITYEEFLPALGVRMAPYQGYQSDLDPGIMNLFATAAYRLGHTMVTEELLLIDNSCNPVDDNLSLIDGFFNPTQIATYGIDPFLKGLSIQTQQEIDVQMIDGLRNFLFAIPGAPFPFGLDLAALNIQRGRDHGLPSYNQIRTYFVGQPARNFSNITRDGSLQNALSSVYDHPNTIDAWVGLVAEDHIPGSSIGPTLNAILSKQFERLRDGDFYYYENDPAINGQLLNDIRTDRLARIIQRNTTITGLQEDVFISMNCEVIATTNEGGNDGGGNNGGGNNGGGGNGGGGNGGGGNGGGGNGGGGNGGGGNGGGGNGGGGNGGGGNGGGGNGGGGNGGGGNGGGGNGGGGNGGGGNGGGGNLIAPTITNTLISTPQEGLTNLTVFPNPSNGLVTIEAISNQQSLKQVTITGINGQQYASKLFDGNTSFYQESFNLEVPAGIYFVKLTTDTDVLTKKVIIQ